MVTYLIEFQNTLYLARSTMIRGEPWWVDGDGRAICKRDEVARGRAMLIADLRANIGWHR